MPEEKQNWGVRVGVEGMSVIVPWSLSGLPRSFGTATGFHSRSASVKRLRVSLVNIGKVEIRCDADTAAALDGRLMAIELDSRL